MSFTNLPTNLTEEAVLVRDGKPDYTKLAADPFPTPTTDEAGAILEDSDTGDRFRWTGAVWVQTSSVGQVTTKPFDYFIEVAQGNIPGALDERIVGRCLNISSTAKHTLWDQGGDYTYLTADTQLYASSSSASDTAVTLLVQGLDDNYDAASATVTLNGQNQVALSRLLFRVHAVIVGNATTPVGDVYIAESDTLTAGVPNTASKIKSKVMLDPKDTGDFASYNISHNGFFTVPAGRSMHVLGLFDTTEKNCDIELDLRARVPGGAWLSLNMIWAYQSPVPLGYLQKPRISEKSDVEMRVISGNPGGAFEANIQFVLIDN